MNNTDKKVYLTAMNDTLINNNNSTDLGLYVMEYEMNLAEISQGEMCPSDSCLALSVRVKNKGTKRIEWGQIYYKRLVKGSTDVTMKKKQLKKIVKEIKDSSDEEKLIFITKPEEGILKRPYIKSFNSISPELTSFFDHLNSASQFDGYPQIHLGGKFPKEALPYLDLAFNKMVVNRQPSFNENKKVR